jgi:alcohol dehydrogenase (cytochrome c)
MRVFVLIGAAVASGCLLASAGAHTNALANVGWGGFGNTPDENRHSPLTQITTSNVDQLGRAFTVDFHAIDSTVRRGEQSYPVESNGTLYLTTNDDNVWALDATTGKVKWRWTPDNVAVFRNFGIVANRGVALCDGHVFVLTLDMTIVQLDPANGQLQRRVAIAQAVPGASSDYGYSETSAPICADHRLIVGAAGSEYGVRGFVMAYHTSDLAPAWPNPFWTIPPAGTEWRSHGTLVGGGVVWTPTTVDTSTNTLYFGTGSATPLYFPSIRPGSNPRADSLISVNLNTGRMRWWQQQMAFNEWSYDTAQPPLVYNAKVGGKKERIVSVATMEGVWFAYDAATGRPIYQRVKVIDRTEHPALQPGKPVAVFPSSIGGLNYSPASYDPHTNYVFNAAAETAAIDVQAKLTPTQKKRKFTLGDVFLGLTNGDFGSILPGWHDHGSISAIDVNTGKQVWKFTTPEPERGGVTTTESGVGFAGDGDGTLRAFDLKTGKVLWTFQTGAQIAAGPSLYSVNGTEYVATTVGGTPTSSNGGVASQLQVFALGASSKQSPPPVLGTVRTGQAAAPAQPATQPKKAAAPVHRAAPVGFGSIVTPAGLVVEPWQANSSNVKTATGRVLLNGAPVAGAHVVVDGYRVPQQTEKDGSFPYDVDVTIAARHHVSVGGLDGATVHGHALSAGQQSALRAASGGFSVGYAPHGVTAVVRSNGTVLVKGRVTDSAGTGPPAVHLLTYRLAGTITDASGKPVQGAVVITRTLDRDFWTHSSASDANGHYSSFFSASDETGANPVTLAVGVALGNVSYGGTLGTNTQFGVLKSATLDVKLGAGTSYTITKPTSYTGAVYSGLIVGVTAGGNVVKPIAETWPDKKGNFTMTLPASVRGKTLQIWENLRQSFSTFTAKPGGSADLASWPSQLGSSVPRALGSIVVPRH